MSPKTCEAYCRDATQFLLFIAEHFGGRVTLNKLAQLAPQDVRAFMAARRAEGIAGRSLMRTLAGVRSFARFLERNHKGKVGALAAVRAPKVGRTLPKPLAIGAAKRVADVDLRAGEEREPWVLARDAAALALLYGSGLRISEALSLRRNDLSSSGDVVVVTGKGGKTRMVPLLPQVLELINTYASLCPYDLPADQPLFVGAKGGPLSPRIVQLVMVAAARRARIARQRHAARIATFLRDASARPWGRPARHPGTARTRVALDHADLYRGRYRAVARSLSERAPAGLNRADAPSCARTRAVRWSPDSKRDREGDHERTRADGACRAHGACGRQQ